MYMHMAMTAIPCFFRLSINESIDPSCDESQMIYHSGHINV
jgi:hypothetical protein